MDEMIEELWEKYSDDYDIRKTEFAQAIQAACNAQANACKRVYADNLFDDTYTAIGNAKIRRKDYE